MLGIPKTIVILGKKQTEIKELRENDRFNHNINKLKSILK